MGETWCEKREMGLHLNILLGLRALNFWHSFKLWWIVWKSRWYKDSSSFEYLLGIFWKTGKQREIQRPGQELQEKMPKNIFWLSFECIVLSTICFEMEESDFEKVDIESSRHPLFLLLFYYFWVSRYATFCLNLPFSLDFLSCGKVGITLHNNANWGKSCPSPKSSSSATAELTNKGVERPIIAVFWGISRQSGAMI